MSAIARKDGTTEEDRMTSSSFQPGEEEFEDVTGHLFTPDEPEGEEEDLEGNAH